MAEMFGNLPDWLGIVLAVAGLFGGSSAGVYRGGLSRARLDLRLEIMQSWTGFIRGGHRFPILSASDCSDELERAQAIHPAGQTDQLIDLLSRYRAMEELARIVRLLPLVDRALWHDWAGSVVSRNRSSWLALLELVHPRYVGERPTHIDCDIDLSIPAPFKPAESFYEHVLRQANPTWSSRWQNLKTRLWVNLKLARPSYRRAVQPSNIRMEDVIRNKTLL
ncbi:MAG: hypothetical protein AAF657_00425 [Acidobacteriota bacterium]